jgi:choline dehydrogenase-like flavoprotein
VHADADYVTSLNRAKSLIDSLDLSLYRARLGSAHVMGGCAMSDDARLGVSNSLGMHQQLDNLSIHDGSLFPTSIGANPQLSIYALCALLTDKLIQRLTTH